tara:strand:- start:1333 stop:1476 length:144 start_codon:yes stop_codon:yes gene_type:complete
MFEAGKLYVFSIKATISAASSLKVPSHSIAWRFKLLANYAPFDIWTD